MYINYYWRRCTLAAALLKPDWQLCRGVELLPKLTEFAERVHSSIASSEQPLAACEFLSQNLLTDDLQLQTFDLCFMYSTMFAAEGENHFMSALSQNLARSLKAGAVVITVDTRLCSADGFDLVAEHQRDTEDSGFSVAFVHKFAASSNNSK
jgi:hypothetical protein